MHASGHVEWWQCSVRLLLPTWINEYSVVIVHDRAVGFLSSYIIANGNDSSFPPSGLEAPAGIGYGLHLHCGSVLWFSSVRLFVVVSMAFDTTQTDCYLWSHQITWKSFRVGEYWKQGSLEGQIGELLVRSGVIRILYGSMRLKRFTMEISRIFRYKFSILFVKIQVINTHDPWRPLIWGIQFVIVFLSSSGQLLQCEISVLKSERVAYPRA